jgi:flagellar biosynthesis/type III secretory pathway protein FliH
VPEFVALADMLKGAPAQPARPPREARGPQPDLATGNEAEHDAAALGPSPVPCLQTTIREARLFRAQLADAFDAALTRLLRELATDVLARELRMAPCDLAALVARLCAQAPGVRLRVAPSEVSDEFGVPCVADPALATGDAILEVDGGVIDARLGVRLALLLEAS